MVGQCANPRCRKPLHYLRDGRIFIFDVVDSATEGGRRTHHLDHYWLCGNCSRTMMIRQEGGGIHIRPLPQSGPLASYDVLAS